MSFHSSDDEREPVDRLDMVFAVAEQYRGKPEKEPFSGIGFLAETISLRMISSVMEDSCPYCKSTRKVCKITCPVIPKCKECFGRQDLDPHGMHFEGCSKRIIGVNDVESSMQRSRERRKIERENYYTTNFHPDNKKQFEKIPLHKNFILDTKNQKSIQSLNSNASVESGNKITLSDFILKNKNQKKKGNKRNANSKRKSKF